MCLCTLMEICDFKCLFVCVGIMADPAHAVGTNITASTVVTVVVDDIVGVEAGLLVVIEADLLMVIEAGSTKTNTCYGHSCLKVLLLFVLYVNI